MTNSAENLKLLQLFEALRQTELPLGIDDYWLLLRALEAGFGRGDRQALKRLCQALWLKTRNPGHLKLFNRRFEDIIPRSFGQPVAGERPADQPKEEGQINRGEAESLGVNEGQTDSKLEAREDLELVSDQAHIQASNIEATSGLEEVQVAALHHEQPDEVNRYYSFTGDYLPVSSRQMKQYWRYLRRASRFGPPVELDLEATINRIAWEGAFFHPVLRPRRVNRTQLILLLDQDGSMVPFHDLSHRLADTARRGGRLGEADIYYFHDCPLEFLYCDPHGQEPMSTTRCLEQMHPIHTSVLIFSDAGAARGNTDPERIAATQDFLKRLREVVRNVVWLNPMPRSRWTTSSAGAIARSVAMVETDPKGLQQAIKVLRGQRPHAQE